MASDSGWILAEFVSGPRNGTLVEFPAASAEARISDLTSPTPTSAGRYRLAGSPADSPATLDSRATAERAAIARFGRGSPDLYIQLVWELGPDGSDTAIELTPSHTIEPAGLLGALIVGDDRTARAIARDSIERGAGFIEMVDSQLAPTMRTIGERWRTGHQGIYEEHRATSIVRRILGEVEAPVRLKPRGRAVTAVLSGDPHGLPSALAAQALRDDGWHVDELGTMVPPDELIDGLDPDRVDLVVLSPTMADNRALSLTTADRLQVLGLVVLVGSPGATLVELQRLAAASLT